MRLPGGKYRIQAPNVTNRLRTALGLVGTYDATLEETIQPVVNVQEGAARTEAIITDPTSGNQATVSDGALRVDPVPDSTRQFQWFQSSGTVPAAGNAGTKQFEFEIEEDKQGVPVYGIAIALDFTPQFGSSGDGRNMGLAYHNSPADAQLFQPPAISLGHGAGDRGPIIAVGDVFQLNAPGGSGGRMLSWVPWYQVRTAGSGSWSVPLRMLHQGIGLSAVTLLMTYQGTVSGSSKNIELWFLGQT